jgi:hypothetical protein
MKKDIIKGLRHPPSPEAMADKERADLPAVALKAFGANERRTASQSVAVILRKARAKRRRPSLNCSAEFKVIQSVSK